VEGPSGGVGGAPVSPAAVVSWISDLVEAARVADFASRLLMPLTLPVDIRPGLQTEGWPHPSAETKPETPVTLRNERTQHVHINLVL